MQEFVSKGYIDANNSRRNKQADKTDKGGDRPYDEEQARSVGAYPSPNSGALIGNEDSGELLVYLILSM